MRRQGLRCTPFQPTTNDKRCTNAHFSSTPLLLYSVCYRAFLIQIKMEKFRISYKNGELVGFHRTEEFKDYDDAYYWCVTQNKFGVVYPESIVIRSI
jgi:hypothetical protein